MQVVGILRPLVETRDYKMLDVSPLLKNVSGTNRNCPLLTVKMVFKGINGVTLSLMSST